MLRIKDEINLDWLMKKYFLRYAGHVDEPGKYLFFSNTFYINPYDRKINIEGRGIEDLNFLYDLIQAGLVEKVED